jgi:hypothetical protein
MATKVAPTPTSVTYYYAIDKMNRQKAEKVLKGGRRVFVQLLVCFEKSFEKGVLDGGGH